jgi:hypothetical protein
MLIKIGCNAQAPALPETTLLAVLLAALLAMLFSPTTFAAEAPSITTLPFELLIADSETCEIVKYGRDGKAVWTYGGIKAFDVWPLKGDEVVVAYLPSELTDNKGGIRIVSRWALASSVPCRASGRILAIWWTKQARKVIKL